MSNKIIFELKRFLFTLYTRFKYHYPLWILFNWKSIRKFKQQKPTLDKTQQRVVDDIKKDGIAITSLNDLFPDKDMLSSLQKHEKERRSERQQYHKKKFYIDYWEKIPQLDLNNPFIEVMLAPRILDIVNSYMEMFTRVTFYTLQMTDVTRDSNRTHSQNWHRDPQEQKFCKVFIYLNDVDENTGPFVYIPQSIRGKKYGHLFPQKPPEGSYPSTESLEKAIPKDAVRVCTGKAGTVIFCDTTGLHRGGYAKEKPRIMSTFSYAAPSFRENKSYWYPDSLQTRIQKLPPQTKFAIQPHWIQRD